MENQRTPPPASAMDPKLFRKAMGCFATGVTIVTTKSEGALYGMTVNSFTSVSLQPMLILVCLANDARTTPAVEARGSFVVNILEEQQVALSNRFAWSEDDRFVNLNYTLNEYDLPVLPGCVAHLVCRVHRVDPGSDHIIVVGEVVKAEFREAAPLLFFRGGYFSLGDNV
ncbi:MAG: flavin reductase family protein [Acidobacteria bacterium]|nr:flavin reductase family protein [Acidobacteriota bacterium]